MTKKLALIVCGLTVLGLVAGPWVTQAQAYDHYGHRPRPHGHHGHHTSQRYLPPPPRPIYGGGFRPAPAYYPPPVAGAQVILGGPRFSIGIGLPLVVPAPQPQYYGPVGDRCYEPYAGW